MLASRALLATATVALLAAVAHVALPAAAGRVQQAVFQVPQTPVSDRRQITRVDDIEAAPHTLEQDGITFSLFTHPQFPKYRIRARKPKGLCDPSVKQISGYLDIAEGKHLFFWFFESRHKPKKDPLVLWLNGGPGCSSSTGLLFELGPCSIAKNGTTTEQNPYAWNSNANVLFLDQPVEVGFSYTTDGSTIGDTGAAAEDVYAFLQLFMANMPKYARLPFHIAAESYGGHFAPRIASAVHRENKNLQRIRTSGSLAERVATEEHVHINLKSIMIGNGLTDPLVQFGSVPEYACDSPYALFEPTSDNCTSMHSKAGTCTSLIKRCYSWNSRLICTPATLYCWSGIAPVAQMGVNLYDTRLPCDRAEDKDGPLCYKELGWIDSWMNRPDIKAELGVPADLEFHSCNMQVNQRFMLNGDGMYNSAGLIPELVEDGIRLLVYNGVYDFMCNYLGSRDWVSALQTSFSKEYSRASLRDWITLDKKLKAGQVRSAGPGAGNVTFVQVSNAGHMVPHDQPEAALDMLNRWIYSAPWQ